MGAIPEKLISQLIEEDEDMRDIVEEFVDSLDERLKELRQAHAATDWEQLAMLAHRLKGAGGSYGYPDISSIGAEMENAFRNQSDGQFDTWVQQLSDLVQAAKSGLSD